MQTTKSAGGCSVVSRGGGGCRAGWGLGPQGLPRKLPEDFKLRRHVTCLARWGTAAGGLWMPKDRWEGLWACEASSALAAGPSRHP